MQGSLGGDYRAQVTAGPRRPNRQIYQIARFDGISYGAMNIERAALYSSAIGAIDLVYAISGFSVGALVGMTGALARNCRRPASSGPTHPVPPTLVAAPVRRHGVFRVVHAFGQANARRLHCPITRRHPPSVLGVTRDRARLWPAPGRGRYRGSGRARRGGGCGAGRDRRRRA